MFLLQVAGAEAVWRCSAERSACRYSGTDLGLGHCGPDGLALRAPLIASACIHARRPRRFWVLPVRLRLILSTAVKPFRNTPDFNCLPRLARPAFLRDLSGARACVRID